MSSSGFSSLAPLEVTPSWALVFYPLIPLLPFNYTEPNFSFPQADWQAGLATPLIRLRIVIYAQDCPRGIRSSIVSDISMLSCHYILVFFLPTIEVWGFIFLLGFV